MSIDKDTSETGFAAAIGQRVAAHRVQRPMRVAELARAVGVSPSLISQIERGQSRPSVATLFAIAQALDVSVDALFGDGTTDPSGPNGRAWPARGLEQARAVRSAPATKRPALEARSAPEARPAPEARSAPESGSAHEARSAAATHLASATRLASAGQPARPPEPARGRFNGSAFGTEPDRDPEHVRRWAEAESRFAQPGLIEPDLAQPDTAVLDTTTPDTTAPDTTTPGSTAARPPRPSERHLVPEPRAPREIRYVVRSEGRAAVDIDGGVRWERLTPQTPQHLDFFEVTYAAHAQLPCHAEVAQWLLVTDGALDVSIGFASYRLYPGDSVQLPPAMPCRCVNPAAEQARAVCVMLYDCVLPEETVRLPISRR